MGVRSRARIGVRGGLWLKCKIMLVIVGYGCFEVRVIILQITVLVMLMEGYMHNNKF